MSFRRGMRVVCVWDAAHFEKAANFALFLGFDLTMPATGAVYLIDELVEQMGWLWLVLEGLPPKQMYRADGFRPAVEGEAELERLRAIVAATPAPAEVRERETAAVGCTRDARASFLASDFWLLASAPGAAP